MRVGRSKHPFGIYTEVFDIGTLRPFFTSYELRRGFVWKAVMARVMPLSSW